MHNVNRRLQQTNKSLTESYCFSRRCFAALSSFAFCLCFLFLIAFFVLLRLCCFAEDDDEERLLFGVEDAAAKEDRVGVLEDEQCLSPGASFTPSFFVCADVAGLKYAVITPPVVTSAKTATKYMTRSRVKLTVLYSSANEPSHEP